MRNELVQQRDLKIAERRIDWVLAHPDMGDWLKGALRGARDRCPVDVLNGLEILNELLPVRRAMLIDLSRQRKEPA